MLRCSLIPVLVLCLPAFGFSQDVKSPQRWETSIQKFERKIEDGTSKPGSVLFIGSSSIVKWDLAKWFPEHQTVNHGFGGSEVSDSLYFFDRIVTPLKPTMIVLYAGDNDIAKGKTAEIVHRNFTRFARKVKADLAPSAKLAFIAIKPSTRRWKLSKEMAKANQLIAKDCKTDDQLQYIDIWSPMLGEDGTPKTKWFVKDGLHLSDAGYDLWTGIVKKHLPNGK